MGYNVWAGTYGNRIDKLGKMVCSQFYTKVLQITRLFLILKILGEKDEGQYSKENSPLERNWSLYNQTYTWYYQSKIPQKWKREEF